MKVSVRLDPTLISMYVSAVAACTVARRISFRTARTKLDYATAAAAGCKLSAEQFAACVEADLNMLLEVSTDYAVEIDIAPQPLKKRHVDLLNRIYAFLANDGDDLVTPAFTEITEVSCDDVDRIDAILKNAAKEVHDLVLGSNASAETAGRILGYHPNRVTELRAERDKLQTQY